MLIALKYDKEKYQYELADEVVIRDMQHCIKTHILKKLGNRKHTFGIIIP